MTMKYLGGNMKYPFSSPVIIDVTKEPYLADNTGKVDCTAALRRVFDDVLIRERDGIRETYDKLESMRRPDGGEVYIGFEDKIRRGKIRVIFPEYTPPACIIYFPAGTYLVSDTVTYTLTDLYNVFNEEPFYAMTRGIHVMGESRESTVIRLADHAEGFEAGANKPVLSFITDARAMETERSNVSQLNTCVDLTIDCGSGNEGAVGLRFIANNSGRIENLSVRSEGSAHGLDMACAAEGVFRHIDIAGFEVGIYTPGSSLGVYDQVTMKRISRVGILAKNASVVCRKVICEDAPLLEPSDNTYCALFDCVGEVSYGDEGVRVYEISGSAVTKNGVPFTTLSSPLSVPDFPDDTAAFKTPIVCVDDFGAIGDGVTDSTEAIQAAFSSGAPTVVFGNGRYLVNGTITVPTSVERVDFLFCDMQAGEKLISGECDCLFRVEGESEIPLRMSNLYTFEQFYGAFRLLCHASRRTLILRDLHTQVAAMYFNTVSGGKVLLDNCVCTTGSYSMNTCLSREGVEPIYAEMIPYEFHGQSVLTYNLNPERGNVEVLNDGSELTALGLKCEGPGTTLKTVRNGKSTVLITSFGIGNPQSPYALFDCDGSGEIVALGAKAFGAMANPTEEYPVLFERAGANRILRPKEICTYFDILNP